MSKKIKLNKSLFPWVGGKARLLRELYDRWPANFDHYVEPFLGGGSVFFNRNFEGKTIELADYQPDIVNAWVVVRDHPEDLLQEFEKYVKLDSKEFFLKIRKKLNLKIKRPIERAALFIYLTKRSYGSMMRISKKGKYCITFNTKKQLSKLIESDVMAISSRLKGSSIKHQSFLEAKIEIKKGRSFYYIDPPYYNTYGDYTKQDFGYHEQVRLRGICDRIHANGDLFMLSNSIHKRVESLYKKYNIDKVVFNRCLDSSLKNEGGHVGEVLITNYGPSEFCSKF